MSRILVIGYNAFDVICPVAGRLAADTKIEVPGIIVGGGGPGATAAVALARLGSRVRLVSPLTDDLPGRLQRQELETAGVDLSLCPLLPGRESAKAVSLVDARRQERTILWSRGDLPRLAAELFERSWLDESDLLYLDGHEPDLSLAAADEAGRRGLPVVLDAGSVRQGSRELVPRCTDVISSAVFAPDLTGEPEPVAALRALARLGPRRVAMTFGARGCLALDGDEVLHVPAFAGTVRDTTGAGDAFHAGYAFARAAGQGWRDCLDHGSAVAALACRDWGGRRGLPTAAETEALLREDRRRPDPPPAGGEGEAG